MTPTSKLPSTTWLYPSFQTSVQKNTTEDLNYEKKYVSSPLEPSTLIFTSQKIISSPPSSHTFSQQQQQQQQQQQTLSKNYFDPFNNNNNNNSGLDELDELTHFLNQQILQEEEEIEKEEKIVSPQSSLDKTKLNIDSSSPLFTPWYTKNPPPPSSLSSNNHQSTWPLAPATPLSFQQEQQLQKSSSLLFGFSSTKSPFHPPSSTSSDSFILPHDINKEKEKKEKGNHWDRFEPYVDESEFDPTIKHQTTNGVSFVPNKEEEKEQQSPSLSQHTEDMIDKVLNHLASIFPNQEKHILLEKFKSFDYDLEKTVEDIILSTTTTTTTTTNITSSSSSSSSTTTTTTTNEYDKMKMDSLILSRSTTPLSNHSDNYHHPTLTSSSSSVTTIKSPKTHTLPTTTGTKPTTRKNQVCRHYLAGECYRKDCWFEHDLDIKPCKFWLQGSCFKGDTCEFAHSLEDIHIVDQVKHTLSSSSNPSSPILSKQHIPTVADFPIITSRSNRKKNKKSHNKKKSFKK
ncbi:hypothetical protein BJ944DRAFT_273908 [Cunninghamella echinulata]|nr:hypothetical protein BJ944DRAFT_273908 [Cunninghamella echinulata]